VVKENAKIENTIGMGKKLPRCQWSNPTVKFFDEQ